MRSAFGGGHIKLGEPCKHKNCGCLYRLCDDISEQCFACGETLKYHISAKMAAFEREVAARDLLITDSLSKGEPPRKIAKDWGVSIWHVLHLRDDRFIAAMAVMQ